jgi:ADP-heptose:LPS heptosyltransferase
MKVLTPRTNVTVAVEHGRHIVELREGVAYVLHDGETASALQAGIAAEIRELQVLPAGPVPLDSAVIDATGTLIVPFIGGFGDALCIMPLLNTIRRRHPNLTIAISTTPGPASVFALAAQPTSLAPYPLTAEQWGMVDWYLHFDDVRHETPGAALTETFARAVGWTLDDGGFDLAIPAEVSVADVMPPSPRIGLAVPDRTNVRATPRDIIQALISRLNDAGMHVLLFGNEDPAWILAVDPQRTLDLRGQTPNVLTLAACIQEMDAMIAHDSLMLHLAGALNIPVVGLFAPTSAAHGAPYPHHLPLVSTMECAPCHHAGPECPRGYESCLAWNDEALAPTSIVNTLCRHLADVYADRAG